MIVHAGLVARRDAGRWRGVLITGPSGAGKSDLALRCLAHGFRLIADDRVVLWRSGDRLFGKAAEPLRDLIELRGLGVLPEPAVDLAEIALVVECAARETIERLPDPAHQTLLGAPIPRLLLSPFDDSAPAKMGRGLKHLGLRR